MSSPARLDAGRATRGRLAPVRGLATYRLFDLAMGRSVVSTLEAQVERESWSAERVAAYASDRLAALLAYARERVPWYRAKGLPDRPSLSDFPLVGKPEIREAGAAMLAEGVDPRRMRRTTSGGSTGTPIEIRLDAAAVDAQSAVVLRHQLWMGLGLVCRHLLLWGPPPGVLTYDTRAGRLRGVLLQRRTIPTFDLDGAHLDQVFATLASWRPDQVIGYSQALFTVATDGRPVPHAPRAVVAAAEMLLPQHRRAIARAFRAPVYERYGCNEFAGIAHDCAKGRLHVNSDRVALEILDGAGRPVSPGEIGEAVVTDLDNRGMPLVRYRIGDALEPGSGCDCGLPLPTLAAVHGRIQDVVKGADGRPVSPRMLAVALAACEEIEGFQLRLRDGVPRRLLVRSRGRHAPDDVLDAVRPLLGATPRVEFHEALERWPSGKMKLVVHEQGD